MRNVDVLIISRLDYYTKKIYLNIYKSILNSFFGSHHAMSFTFFLYEGEVIHLFSQ